MHLIISYLPHFGHANLDAESFARLRLHELQVIFASMEGIEKGWFIKVLAV